MAVSVRDISERDTTLCPKKHPRHFRQ